MNTKFMGTTLLASALMAISLHAQAQTPANTQPAAAGGPPPSLTDPANAKIAPGIPLPGIVETAKGFLQAIAENRLSDAAKLADDDYAQAHMAGWNKSRESMNLSHVRIVDASEAADRACVVTSAFSEPESGKSFLLGFTLIKKDGRWVIWKGRQLHGDSGEAFIQDFKKTWSGAKAIQSADSPKAAISADAEEPIGPDDATIDKILVGRTIRIGSAREVVVTKILAMKRDEPRLMVEGANKNVPPNVPIFTIRFRAATEDGTAEFEGAFFQKTPAHWVWMTAVEDGFKFDGPWEPPFNTRPIK